MAKGQRLKCSKLSPYCAKLISLQRVAKTLA
jgi:hypothetical protein